MDNKRKFTYVPKLKYDDEIDHPLRGRLAGKSYRSERAMLEAAEYCYKSKIKSRRRIKRKYHLLYQVLLESGITVEIAYLEVGIKGYYVRYNKVKKMNWRQSRKTGSRTRVPVELPEIDVAEFRKSKSEEEMYKLRQQRHAAARRYKRKKKRQEQLRKEFYEKLGLEGEDQ